MIDVYYTTAPASEGIPEELIAAGATGVRLTFSFGTPEIQLDRAVRAKAAAKKLGKTILTMADLPGGGWRLSGFSYENNGYFLVQKSEVIGLCGATVTDLREKSLPLPDNLFDTLVTGQRLVVGDGLVSFMVGEDDGELVARAEVWGRVESNRSISVQGGHVSPVCLTEADIKALEHIEAHDEYDEVALSFVGRAEDIQTARAILKTSEKRIVAKIETPVGVMNSDEIASEADVVMVARGDLALTMSWQEMPKAVDRVVAACELARTPYIIATQVAESMSTSHMMTRAEMSDLWQWKKRGAAGVLLSRETGWGDHPEKVVAAVRTLLAVE